MRTRTPPRTKERYILDSIPKIFKGGEWIESIPENNSSAAENGKSQIGGEGSSDRGDVKDSTGTAYMTIIGGQKYDAPAYRKELLARMPFFGDMPTLITGDGRGAEKEGLQLWPKSLKIDPDPDLYGKNARKVNVEQVLSFAPESPLLLVGEGERVKQARAWLKRARWPREVIELP